MNKRLRLEVHTSTPQLRSLCNRSLWFVPRPGGIPERHPLSMWTSKDLISLTVAGEMMSVIV